MKFLFDFFPVLLFFVAYKVADIYVATATAIAASLAQTALQWYWHRRLEPLHLITLAMILVFGGATLLLQDEDFIKWKPSAVNWLIAILFLGSQFTGKPLVKRLLGSVAEMPQRMWLRLNTAWSLFFLASGCANLYVAYTFDTDTWVNFKLFGLTGLTFVFIIFQSFYIARYIKDEEQIEREKP